MSSRATVPVHVQDLRSEWLRLEGEAARAKIAADGAWREAAAAHRQYLQASRDEQEGNVMAILQRRRNREIEGQRRVAEIIERAEREQLAQRVEAMQPKPERQPRTHCVNGHELTDENTYERENGKRRCKQCHLAAVRSYKRECKEILGT